MPGTAWGTAGMVCGIASLCSVFMPYFGLTLGIISVVFSRIQKRHKSISRATTALVLGIIGICINSIMLLVMLFTLFMGWW